MAVDLALVSLITHFLVSIRSHKPLLVAKALAPRLDIRPNSWLSPAAEGTRLQVWSPEDGQERRADRGPARAGGQQSNINSMLLPLSAAPLASRLHRIERIPRWDRKRGPE